MDCPRCHHTIARDTQLPLRCSSSESLTALTIHKLSTMVRSAISRVVVQQRKSSKHSSASTSSLSSNTSLESPSSRNISHRPSRPSSSLSSVSASASSHISGLWLFSMWLSLFVVVVAGQSQQMAAQQVEDVVLADHYLNTFGYYRHGKVHHSVTTDSTTLADDVSGVSHPTSETLQDTEFHTEDERRQAVERLQTFFHLPVTGQLDKKTKEMMAAPRCGREDLDDDEAAVDVKQVVNGGNLRKKRYAITTNHDGSPSKWTQNQLTWRITKPSHQIPVSQQRRIMSEALDAWARVVPVKFVEIPAGGEVPDIDIQFARGRHGPESDPVFDGAPKNIENVLAHAWGPGNRVKDLPGDVHFDEGDDWSNADTLLGVAVHELGHVMGLAHSNDETAIMFPAYRDVTALGQDDIAGIYAIYGTNGRPQIRPITSRPDVGRPEEPRYTVAPEWGTPAPIATTTPNLCQYVTVDAVFEDPDARLAPVYYAISGSDVHKLASNGRILVSKPLKDVFPELPGRPDAAFSVRENQAVYFIKDNQLWAYQGEQLLEGFPRSLSRHNFPETPKYALSWPDGRGNTLLFLFGKVYWWRYDVDRSAIVQYSLISEFSAAFPADVVFASVWSDNRLYAVTRDGYTIMDMNRREITHQEPLLGKPQWLHGLCSHSDNNNSSRCIVNMTLLVGLLTVVNLVKSFLGDRRSH